ncbi:hypothetical protein ADP71_04080 [Vitreoscilla sp. C1]|uniref:general secretion pathway protein GspG n=1 Tax=Vitreoscilla sp. (strain C1) TaxID=96942 RepID=UPI000CDC2858|nr:general secretion pathway protein GspG [Vitreoscilla sp. C1]AUZ04205.1 hypothetical protein ADP71_04080 [Vitreoscilla sp. C1]
MSLNRIATKQEVIARLTQGTDDIISEHAQFIRTENGYWVAWHEQVATIIHEDATDDEVSFQVEGVATLSELVDMLTNGDFDVVEDFEGDDEAWDDVVLDSDAHSHEHEHGEHCHHDGCNHKH